MKRRFYFIFGVFIFLTVVFCAAKEDVSAFYNNAKDSLTRIKINEMASHTINFALTNNERIEIGYNLMLSFKKDGAGFSINESSLLPGDIDFFDGTEREIVAINGSCDGFNGANDLSVLVNQSLGTITFVPCSGYIPSTRNTNISIKIGNAATHNGLGANKITNPPTSGAYYINIGHNNQPGTNIAVFIVTDDSLSVSATVDPSISIFMSTQKTLGFGNATTSQPRFATQDGAGSLLEPPSGQPVTISVGTNGQGGIILYMYDKGNGTDSGLWSSDLNEIIPAAPSNQVINNSKLFGVYGKNSTGLLLNNSFDNNEANGENPISIAPQILAQNNNPFASGSLDLVLKAATNNTTKAGKYSDIITILCTAIY